MDENKKKKLNCKDVKIEKEQKIYLLKIMHKK